jgi:hypothetical protein
MAREFDYDLYFPAVAYYDGESFMLPRSRNKETALESRPTASKSAERTESAWRLCLPSGNYFGRSAQEKIAASNEQSQSNKRG